MIGQHVSANTKLKVTAQLEGYIVSIDFVRFDANTKVQQSAANPRWLQVKISSQS